MTLLKKINNARKDFLEGYESKRYLVNNINKEKGEWIYKNKDKFIENVKLMQKNNFTKIGMQIYFLINPLKGSEYVSFMSGYYLQHREFLKKE